MTDRKDDDCVKNLAHSGPLAPVATFADLQARVGETLAPWNAVLGGESPHNVSVRVSQAVLADAATTADHLQLLLADHHLRLAGFSAVNISGGSKDHVHAPDWRTEERLAFMFAATNLAAAVRGIAADDATGENAIGVTTTALSSRAWVDADMPGNWAALTLNIIRLVQHLVQIRERTGITIHVDLEVEPGSLLRDLDDVSRFFSQWLLGRGVAMLSDRMPITSGTATEAILRHVRIALDTAHMAVVTPGAAIDDTLDRLLAAGIRIGRVQLSAALEVQIPESPVAIRDLASQLTSLVSASLLQQVVAWRGDDIVARFTDLPEALHAIDGAVGETWRIHTHAPLLADRYGVYRAMRGETVAWLRAIRAWGMEPELIELRSATWDVVPADDRDDIAQMIAREGMWVQQALATRW